MWKYICTRTSFNELSDIDADVIILVLVYSIVCAISVVSFSQLQQRPKGISSNVAWCYIKGGVGEQ